MCKRLLQPLLVQHNPCPDLDSSGRVVIYCRRRPFPTHSRVWLHLRRRPVARMDVSRPALSFSLHFRSLGYQARQAFDHGLRASSAVFLLTFFDAFVGAANTSSVVTLSDTFPFAYGSRCSHQIRTVVLGTVLASVPSARPDNKGGNVEL